MTNDQYWVEVTRATRKIEGESRTKEVEGRHMAEHVDMTAANIANSPRVEPLDILRYTAHRNAYMVQENRPLEEDNVDEMLQTLAYWAFLSDIVALYYEEYGA